MQSFAEKLQNFVRLYEWYPMTPTVHKILAHGPTIIEYAILPIGQLSEEAAEARNKHFRQYRVHFARKFSRTSCNIDVINRLLLSSDPFLSCSRPLIRREKKPFSKEALGYLLPMETVYFHGEVNTSHNSEDEYVISNEDE